MKIAITADLHVQAKKLDDIRCGWEELINHLIINKIPYLLIAGDIFTNYNVAGREASFGTVYSALADPLRRYVQKGGHVYAIPGNHDIAGQNQKDALVSLEELISVIRDPMGIPLAKTGGEIYVQFLPWLYNNTIPHDQLIPKAQKGRFNILLGHCEVSGTQANNHYIVPVGGHFEIPREAFSGKGYDYIALGHIHKRVDYYTGAPWQLTFGEEGNPPGFVVLDIENGKARESWVDLTSTPQYHTYDTSKTKNIPQTVTSDYVKIKYSGEPPAIAMNGNVTLEKIPDQGVARTRTNITTGSSAKEMVDEWCKGQDAKNTPPAEDILRVAGEYFNSVNSTPSVGSIEFIESVRISNVGPHTETYIDFTAPGINGHKYFALSGHNGSGKTFSIDSIFAALFGSFPSRKGSLYEHIRPGCENAAICMVFRSHGKRYSAHRKFTAKKRHEALLTDLETNKIIAGPKISDFDREIRTLVGSEDIVLASVFSAQKGVGDLVSAEPIKRKEIMWQILNINTLINISEAAQQKANQLKAEIDAGNRRIKELEDRFPAAYIAAARIDIANLDSRISDTQRQIVGYGKEIKDITEEGQKLRDEIARTDAAKKALSELSGEIASLDNEITNIKEKISRENACLKMKPTLTLRQKEIEAAKAEYQSLQMKHEENLRAEASIASLNGGICANKMRIAGEEDRLKEEIAYLLHSVESSRRECEKLVASYQSMLGMYAESQKSLNSAGCSKSPLPCPFIEEAIVAKDRAAEVQQKLNQTSEAFREKCEDVERRIKELEAALGQESFAKESRARILKLQEDIKKIALCAIPKERLAELKKLAESEGEIASKLQAIESSKEAIVDLEKRLKAKNTERGNKKAKADMLSNEINANKQSEERYAALKKDWESKSKAKDEAQHQLTEVYASRAALVERISQHEKELAELASLKQRDGESKQEYRLHETVARAFGKNGIPQLLIDSALPQIQDIFCGLLAQLDNKFAIRFATQTETQSGSVREAIDILAGDELGERDIGNFSGGEQKLLKSIVRIALAVFQAQRHGSRYEILVIDEVFDALDRENALKVLQILYMLSDRFKQIVVVSHTDDLLLEFPVRMDFEKTHQGTTLSLVVA